MKLVTDTGIVFTRELRPVLREPFSLAIALAQPVVFLGLFGPLVYGSTGESLQWFVPGVLVMLGMFGTSATGANLLFELQTGAHERMLVTPLARPALLLGRALKELFPLLVQAVLIVLLTVPFGFRPSPVGAPVALLILGVFGVGLGALSYALALAVRKQEWMFWVVQQSLLYPLMITAGMMLPLSTAPGWLRAISHANPLTYVVEAERALFAGDLALRPLLTGGAAAALTALIGLTLGIRAMRNSAT
ncbi:transport permease protein [Virgisporangium aliadipatigenens]|uniref:Transport permease protein n=1 Tax=Virgisporangium aliadipatigenens TaxID=741659 RepID=A0A8J3YPU8_9ACTN|nr:ABC transporter permease [Virgisporangium aliadipatigenens]GIJ47618.1 transport permease protein [Virgisporangium aliadipatigenens]